MTGGGLMKTDQAIRQWGRKLGFVLLLILTAGGAWAAAVSWDNEAGTGLWSNPTNWAPDGLPGAADDVSISNSVTTCDTNLTVNSLTLAPINATDLKIDGSGIITINAALTRNGPYVPTISISAPVALGGTVTAQCPTYAFFDWKGPISGTNKLVVDGAFIMLHGANTWSGGLDFRRGTLSMANVGLAQTANRLGNGNVTFGSDGNDTQLSIGTLYNMLTVGNPSNTITVAAGTGLRRIIVGYAPNLMTIHNAWILDTNLTVDLVGYAYVDGYQAASLKLTGTIGGVGAITMTGGTNDTLTLAGTCTNQGTLEIKTGTLSLEGRWAGGSITVGTNDTAVLKGKDGTFAFDDGEAILVATNGTLNMQDLRFDLTALTGTDHVLATYTNGTLINTPTNIQDMMTYSSTNKGMVLVITNRTIRTEAGTPVLTPPPDVPTTTNTWTGGGGSAFWSNPLNWSLGRVPSNTDELVIGAATTVDTNSAAHTVKITGAYSISVANSATLSFRRLNKTAGGGINIDPAIPLTTDLRVNRVGHVAFKGAISGPYKVLVGSDSGDQLQMLANHTFSGGLYVDSGLVVFNYNHALGTGPVYLGKDAGEAGLFYYYTGGTYTYCTNTVYVQAGAGSRRIYTQYGAAPILPFRFVLNTNLVLDGLYTGGGVCTLSGTISGPGGLVVNNASAKSNTWILAGSNTYQGATRVKDGVLTINGSLTNGNLIVGGTALAARANGSGTIGYLPGDRTVVTNNGTLDARSLKLDLTGLPENPTTLIRYAGGGTVLTPATLNDLLTAASLGRKWSLADTGSEIQAKRPPRGTLIVVR